MSKTLKEHAKKCKSTQKESLENECHSSCVCDCNCDCDSYHTFDELYEHRITLYIALCRTTCKYWRNSEDVPFTRVWRSRLHSDGSSFAGWFILGINSMKGEQITYHLPLEKWGDTDFAEELYKAPEFDGHTSDDVLERINNL